MIIFPITVNRREKPLDLGIRTCSLAGLIKYLNVNKAFVSELFNYSEGKTLPHVHFPDENNDLGNNLPDNALYNL